jgi:Predicted 3''-5'' exonuclease related to the exonuclease domain of PolB.
MSSSPIVFDIETGGLDDETLVTLAPEFIPPPAPGEFNPASVKVGNIKDQDKINAKIQEARDAHAAAVAIHPKVIEEARASHLAEFRSKAALSPLTGRVLAIGFRSDKGFLIEDGGGDEPELLERFWQTYAKCRANAGGPRQMVGWNILLFDLPFLIRRSWFHEIVVPQAAFDGRAFDPLFIDLMPRFTPGGWREFVKLDTAAKFFKCGAKLDGVNGEDFARLWLSGNAEEKQRAICYLENDLEMTRGVAMRMGIAA